MQTHRLLYFAAALFISGCANDPFEPLAKALRTSDTKPVVQQKQAACNSFGFVSPLDVDTAYARARRTFKFRTLEERKRETEDGLTAIDTNFRHSAHAGSYYEMRDHAVVVDENGTPHRVWSSLELSKEGPLKTRVDGSYCIHPKQSRGADPAFAAAVEKAFRNTLK